MNNNDLFMSIKNTNRNTNMSKRITLDCLIDFIKKNYRPTEDKKIFKDDILQPLEQKQVSLVINLSDNLNSIFCNFVADFTRIGVIYSIMPGDIVFTKISTQINISLLSSVLSCVVDDFIEKSEGVQKIYVRRLISNMEVFIGDSQKYKDNKYKELGWTKKTMQDEIKQHNFNSNIALKIISDMFHVNILVLNISQDKIITPNKYHNTKKSIMLILHDDLYFEPIIWKLNRLIDCDNCSVLTNHIMKNQKQIVVSCSDGLLKKTNGMDAGGDADDIKYLLSLNGDAKNATKYSGLSRTEKNLVSSVSKYMSKKNFKVDGDAVCQDKDVCKYDDNPMENNVEGMNGIVECSEIVNMNVADISEVGNESNDDDDVSEATETNKVMHKELYKRASKYNENKTKLDELQKDATLCKIPLTNDIGNRKKNKTKKQLIDEIKIFLSA